MHTPEVLVDLPIPSMAAQPPPDEELLSAALPNDCQHHGLVKHNDHLIAHQKMIEQWKSFLLWVCPLGVVKT